MMFLWGVVTVMAVGLLFAVVFDGDVRDAVLTVGWALLIGVPVMLWLGAALLLRKLPGRLRPRMVRGRRLSARGLQRVADRVTHDGWMVSMPTVSIIVLKRKADS